MTAEPEFRAPDDERLKRAIDNLIAAIRKNQSGADEIAVLMDMGSRWRDANQHLVLAAVRAQVMQEQAEARNRQHNEFLAMLAHELRNPLAPISNAATLLKKVGPAHPLLPRIHTIITRQVGQMARLIDDLLDASRVTSGKVVLQKACITLNEVIDRSMEMVHPMIQQRNQQLVVQSMPEPIPLEGDLVRLSQVLSNLLVNASNYSPGKGLIEIGIRRQPNLTRCRSLSGTMA